MEDRTGLNAILYVFVLIVISVTLISVVGDLVFENTNTYPVTNETLLITSLRIWSNNINESLHVSPSNGDWASITSIRYDNGTALILNADYNVSTAWNITFLNSSHMVNYENNGTNLTYTWYPPEYVKDSTSRVMLGLIVLLVALGLMLIVVGIIMRAYGYDLASIVKR